MTSVAPARWGGPGASDLVADPTYTWTMTASRSQAEASVVPGVVEAWTLTCERHGRVVQTVPVVVDRGQRLAVDLSTCGRR